jgi:hypothetical protein
MKPFPCALVLVTLLPGLVGCTAVSLERHTANQAMTGTDMRYQLALDTLVKMAANPGNLPSLGTATDGQAFVVDNATFDAKTGLAAIKGFTGETLSGSATRSPQNIWTIDPVHTPDQILAIQAACRWVLTGIEPNGPNDLIVSQLLKDFQVYDDLKCLNEPQNRGWFSIGCKQNAPKHGCYVANYCDMYLWITPGGLKGLSEFTLILTDIATIDPISLFGTAGVGVFRVDDKGQLDSKALLTQQLPYRINDSDGVSVELMAPVVCYGNPDKKADLQFKPVDTNNIWCDKRQALMADFVSGQSMSRELVDAYSNRVFQPATPPASAAFNFRNQQQMWQGQTQLFQSQFLK